MVMFSSSCPLPKNLMYGNVYIHNCLLNFVRNNISNESISKIRSQPSLNLIECLCVATTKVIDPSYNDSYEGLFYQHRDGFLDVPEGYFWNLWMRNGCFAFLQSKLFVM